HRRDLAAEEDRERGEVEPEHEHDDGADRAVGRAVAPEVRHVDLEPRRGEQPDERADDGADQHRRLRVALVAVGQHVVEEREERDDEDEGEDPGAELGGGADAERADDRHAGDDGERAAHEQHEPGDEEQERDPALLQEAAVLAHVVHAVEPVGERGDAAGRGPQGEQQADAERAGLRAAGDLADSAPEQPCGLRRHAPLDLRHDPVERALAAEEPGQREEDQDQREEREEEVVGDLGGLARDVVRDRFAEDALELPHPGHPFTRPWGWMQERCRRWHGGGSTRRPDGYAARRSIAGSASSGATGRAYRSSASVYASNSVGGAATLRPDTIFLNWIAFTTALPRLWLLRTPSTVSVVRSRAISLAREAHGRSSACS